MGKETLIEWAMHTGGPYLGCEPVTPGCVNCYAWALALTRLEPIFRAAYKKAGFKDWETRPVWGRDATRVLTKGFWREAVRINAQHAKAGTRGRWFPSLIDWLDEMPGGIIDQDGNKLEPIAVLADFLRLIHDTPNIDWLLLTKRPENWRARVGLANDAMELGSPERIWATAWAALKNPPHNVWIGATVENQAMADERIPLLVNIPARVRFLSVEPMLENIDLTRLEADESLGVTYNALTGFGTWNSERVAEPIHWVIFGGESDGRACNIDWIYDGVQQCQRAGVKCFVKQLGSNAHTGNANLYDWPDSTELVASCCIEGAAAAGIKTRHRKGGDMAEWPEQLRVREVPL
jgi:protein gp37